MTQDSLTPVPVSARLKAHRLLALAVLATLLATIGASLARADGAPEKASAAARKTQTLHYFSKDVSVTVTHADGTVVRKPPFPDAEPGDVVEVNSLDYVGNHRHHARRWTASHHLRCEFETAEPDCVSYVAIGGSLLIFEGFPGTLTDGTGRYQGATGRVLKNKDVGGGSDIVARIRLR